MDDREVFARLNRPAPRNVANQIVRGALSWKRVREVRAGAFREFVERLRMEPDFEDLLRDIDEVLELDDERLGESWMDAIPHPELSLKKALRDARRASEKFAHWLETGEYLSDEELPGRQRPD